MKIHFTRILAMIALGGLLIAGNSALAQGKRRGDDDNNQGRRERARNGRQVLKKLKNQDDRPRTRTGNDDNDRLRIGKKIRERTEKSNRPKIDRKKLPKTDRKRLPNIGDRGRADNDRDTRPKNGKKKLPGSGDRDNRNDGRRFLPRRRGGDNDSQRGRILPRLDGDNVRKTIPDEDRIGRRRIFKSRGLDIERNDVQLRTRILRNRLGLGGLNGRNRARHNIRSNDDWQYWFSDYYGGRSRWYRGHWNGNWRGRWNTRWSSRWSRYPVVLRFGISPWGFNRTGYWFGYRNYYNPYYTGPVVVGSTRLDYSHALAAPPYQGEFPDDAERLFAHAREVFRQQKYDESLRYTNAALALVPQDAAINEFRALVLFATGDYKPAAATLHAVLAVGPGWDWNTMRDLYGSVPVYTRHLRALEQHVRESPKDAAAHFLLSYHYMTMGHVDAATAKLKETIKLVPRDNVARTMLGMISDDEAARLPGPTKDFSASKVEVAQLLGTWNAMRNGETFQLKLTKDDRFVWTHANGKEKTEITGVYAVEDGTLALEPDAGGVMLGRVALNGRNTMTFQMVGAPSDDQGLTFTK